MSLTATSTITETLPSPSADRRRFARFAGPPAVVSGDWSRVYDISLGGICLEGDEPVRPGDMVDLIITDKDCFHTATIPAEVVWKRGSRVGLRWVVTDDFQRHWLERRCGL